MYSLILFLVLLPLSVCASGGCDPCSPCGAGNDCISVAQCRTECNNCLSNKGCGDDDYGAHTYFKPRQVTPNNVFQHNLTLYWWYHDVLCESDCTWWTMQVSPFYQRSTGQKSVAQYFLPCKKADISIREDGTGDVGSVWFNLLAAQGESFDACLSLRPRRSVAGAYFNFRFDLSKIVCHGWLDIAFAAMRAKHNVNMCVTNINGDGVACDIQDVYEALNQPDWFYGKLCPCALDRKGVDDIQIRFGYDWFYCDTNHISPYMVGIVATGKRSNAEYLFEPVVGSKHGSVGLGVIGDVRLWECEDRELTLLTDFKYRYVLSACERRSFDLCKNGDWSRYLPVVTEQARSNPLPGVNFLTQDVQVTPRSTVDWFVAFHYQQCQWNVEVGYDFWWRAQELVELCSFAKGLGIYDVVGDCNINPVSASCATICQSVTSNNPAPSDSSFVQLTCEDINLNSGATPRALSNTIYVACGYDGEWSCYPAFIGFGGSYEFGHECSALSNWAVWFKTAVSF